MAKLPPRSSARRVPPTPDDTSAAVDDWLQRVMPDLQPIVSAVDDQIRELLPDVQFAVKWKKAHYGLPDLGWVIELVAYDVSANVVFFAGSEFDPPPPLGDYETSRYVKLRSVEDALAPELAEWIRQSANHPGWK